MSENGLTLERLWARADDLREEWSSKQPFRYLIIDDFLDAAFAEAILSTYPGCEAEEWNRKNYIHQRKKLTSSANFPAPAARFFELTASTEFCNLITEITGVADILHDPDLVGGGLHQILQGGFLDVHVDYNFHPFTKHHRRLNLLLYMNKDWKPEFEGYLELWDMRAKRRLENIAPIFNRAVLFETNEVSYHGHPRPLNAPPGVTRKSLAIYYYTKEREVETIAPEHNTLYRQTTGIVGYLKTTKSALGAAMWRLKRQGLRGLGENLIRRTQRRVRGLPPENN